MNKLTTKQLVNLILTGVVAFNATAIILAINYKNSQFGTVTLDELIFYATNNFTGANISAFSDAVKSRLFIALFATLIYIIPVFIVHFGHHYLEIKIKSRNFTIGLGQNRRMTKAIFTLSPLLVAIIIANNSLQIAAYAKNSVRVSSFFSENYIDPRQTKLSWPEEKRNLIYIQLESLENTVMSKENGGMKDISLVPELEQIALQPEHINFSHNDKLGGALETQGSTWTVAAMASQTAGIPILTPAGGKFDNYLSIFGPFLPGSHSLGEVLAKAGYKNTLMVGSDADFGGRSNYFEQHGDYEIYDLKRAKTNGKIPIDYDIGWWGFEDRKLYEFAKEELTELAKSSQPFNFQLLTVDTHFLDGWLDPKCPVKFENKYDNVHACALIMLADFLDWIKNQPFYENTTVVVVGDHLVMQSAYSSKIIGERDYTRSGYNVFINSLSHTSKTKNRQISNFDYYPTILSALGVKIEGERLGLGTNLFSDEPTLFEKFGARYVNDQLKMRQPAYDNLILRNQKINSK